MPLHGEHEVVFSSALHRFLDVIFRTPGGQLQSIADDIGGLMMAGVDGDLRFGIRRHSTRGAKNRSQPGLRIDVSAVRLDNGPFWIVIHRRGQMLIKRTGAPYVERLPAVEL